MPDPSEKINGWLSDVATSFMTWTFVGATWGAFNPYPVPNSKQALAKTFVPLPPLSSLRSIGFYAGLAGSVAAVQRFAAGGMAVARDRRDVWNELIGLGAVYGYGKYVFKTEKRMSWNNRAVAGIVVGSIVYANTAP